MSSSRALPIAALLATAVLVGLGAACTHELPTAGAPHHDGRAPADNETPPPAPPPPVGTDPSAVPGDGNGDGVVPSGPPGPPPAETAQSCVLWSDCGPNYGDQNSGFECVDSSCTCDPGNVWGDACAAVGGSWSRFECLCVTDATMPMPAAAPETPEQADEGTSCWWVWRWRYCDPDEWVDTSYPERVCDDEDCWTEWVDDGYWIDGSCYGRWIKRCDDGNEYWY